MNEGSDKKFWIISIIIILVVLGLTYKFVIMYDTSGNNAGSSNVEKNDKPALTLKADKEAQAEKEKKAEEENKKEESKSDDKKDPKKDDKKENDKNTDVKALKKEAQTNAETVLDIQGKPKDDFKSDNTQARFKEAATEQFVKTHQKNDNKGNRKIEYKNVSLNLDKDEDVKKDKLEGVLKFDRLIKPKDKDSKVKASTEVDSKLQVTFEKEDGKLKVAKTQM
ncbi:hypothetical protein BU064_03410 [Staphylococcus succinus]|nr:hypothetical protein BU064_03410 [Staphylococcus succinus]RIM48148.1 hypothetical protein BUY22_02175 [Staphylococcus cohnii]